MMPTTAAVTAPAAVVNTTKTWRKAITGIDLCQHKGHALIGSWMTAGGRYRLPVGALRTLESGHVYETRYRTSLHQQTRHFLTVSDDGDVIDLTVEEVRQWLSGCSATMS